MRDRKVSYLLLFAASVLVHLAVVAVLGIELTRDFIYSYDLPARAFADWAQSAGPFPSTDRVVVLVHFVYVLFVGSVYTVFGKGNHAALIAVQVVLSSLSALLIYRVMRKHAAFAAIAFGTAAATFLFFESMHYNIVGSPESLYRSLLILFFFGLVDRYEKNRAAAFFGLAALSFVLLVFIRIDTAILFIPVYVLGAKIILDRLGVQGTRLAPLAGAIVAALIVVSLWMKLPDAGGKIGALDRDYFVRGIVVADLGEAGQIEPMDPGRQEDWGYIARRFSELFVLRVCEYFNVLPPTWSKGHLAYYALHIVPLYILGLSGAWRACGERNRVFLLIALMYLSSVVMHGLTRVDAAHRTLFVPFVFLIMLAGYGADGLVGRWRTCRAALRPEHRGVPGVREKKFEEARS